MFYILCLNNENLFGFTVLRTNEKDVKIINLSQGDHLSVSFLALPRPSRRWILDLWRLTELSRKINWNTHLTNAFENHQHQHMTFRYVSLPRRFHQAGLLLFCWQSFLSLASGLQLIIISVSEPARHFCLQQLNRKMRFNRHWKWTSSGSCHYLGLFCLLNKVFL